MSLDVSAIEVMAAVLPVVPAANASSGASALAAQAVPSTVRPPFTKRRREIGNMIEPLLASPGLMCVRHFCHGRSLLWRGAGWIHGRILRAGGLVAIARLERPDRRLVADRRAHGRPVRDLGELNGRARVLQ